MSMQDLEEIIKAEGWAKYTQTRYHQQYVYASRRQGKQVLKAYIAPVKRIDSLTAAQVQQILRKAENKKA